MTAPTRFLNYPAGSGTNLPPIVGPDMFGGMWRGVTCEVTETGVRVGFLPIPPADITLDLLMRLVPR